MPSAGDTAKIGAGLTGSFQVTLPTDPFSFGADALLWYATLSNGTVSFDGTGGTFSMPARADAGYAETLISFNTPSGEPFISVERKKIIDKAKVPDPAAATDAQMTSSDAKFHYESANGINEFHFDSGTVNLSNPSGTALANTVFVGGTYDSGTPTDNLIYVHGGTLYLPVLNYTAYSSGHSLLQFDGGETTILKTSCWPDLRTTPPQLTKTDELLITGKGTVVDFKDGLCLARALDT